MVCWFVRIKLNNKHAQQRVVQQFAAEQNRVICNDEQYFGTILLLDDCGDG